MLAGSGAVKRRPSLDPLVQARALR